MPATVLFTSPIIGPYTTTPVTALALDVTFAAADPVNGNTFAWDAPSGDILIVWNTDTAAHHFTLTSTADAPFLRTGDITSYVVGAGVISFYNLAPDAETGDITGWDDGFGNIGVSADSALIMFAIIER